MLAQPTEIDLQYLAKDLGISFSHLGRNLIDPPHLLTSYYLHESRRQFILNSTPKFNKETRKILYHVLACTQHRLRKELSINIPIPFHLLNNVNLIQLSQLVDISKHSFTNHKCREFTIKPFFYQDFIGQPKHGNYINCFNGRKRKLKHNLKTSKGKSTTSNLIETAVPLHKPIRLNEINLLELLQISYALEKTTLRSSDRARLEQDIFNLEAILSDMTHGFYSPHYDPCITGRIFQIMGGFQNLRKELQAKLLEGTTYYNYDLKSSQCYILLAELEKYSIPCPYLTAYLQSDKSKYASKLNLPINIWKECLYATIYGSGLPSLSTQESFIKYCKVSEGVCSILHDYDSNSGLINYQRFKEEVKPLHKALKIYRRKLKTLGPKNLINACDLQSPYKQGFQLSSHIIQGIESAFIYNLTILCSKNGIDVYQNCHDGLITGHPIPNELVEQATAILRKHTTAKFTLLQKPIFEEEPISSMPKATLEDYKRQGNKNKFKGFSKSVKDSSGNYKTNPINPSIYHEEDKEDEEPYIDEWYESTKDLAPQRCMCCHQLLPGSKFPLGQVCLKCEMGIFSG